MRGKAYVIRADAERGQTLGIDQPPDAILQFNAEDAACRLRGAPWSGDDANSGTAAGAAAVTTRHAQTQSKTHESWTVRIEGYLAK